MEGSPLVLLESVEELSPTLDWATETQKPEPYNVDESRHVNRSGLGCADNLGRSQLTAPRLVLDKGIDLSMVRMAEPHTDGRVEEEHIRL